jgi:hypothetical protein
MSAQFPAVIVVRNEEALIRCLESVAWCEERIAIDMDTTDRTRELPKLGVRLCAQVATGDGAAGVWLPRMLLVRSPTAAHRRLPGLPAAVLSRGAGLYPDRLQGPEIVGACCFFRSKRTHGFSTSATASGRRARGPRVPPAVVSPQHGMRTT